MKFRILACLLLMSGCSGHTQKWGLESFDKGENWETPVLFELDFPDSTTSFGLDICAQIYGGFSSIKENSLPVVIEYFTPDSSKFNDTIQLPLNVRDDANIINKKGRVVTIKWPYRRGIVNRLPGRWEILLAPDTTHTFPFSKVRAIGINVCKDVRKR